MPKKKTTKSSSTPKKKVAKPKEAASPKGKPSSTGPKKKAVKKKSVKKAAPAPVPSTRSRTFGVAPDIGELVLRTLKDSGRAMTSGEIATSLGIDESIVLATLGDLVTRGFVMRVTSTTYRYVSGL